MKLSTLSYLALAGGFLAASLPAYAHVALVDSNAAPGATYLAVFQVAHGCDALPTTGLRVEIPAGFELTLPQAKAGWTALVSQAKTSSAANPQALQKPVTSVSWTANNKAVAGSQAAKEAFVLSGKLPGSAGPLWFKVLQTCGTTRLDWVEIPDAGVSTQGLKYPAVLLNVGTQTPVTAQTLAPDKTQVQFSNAWIRATVAGQTGSGAFMRLTSPTDRRLISISTPVAGIAQVHEMKMDGNVMKMRALDYGLALPAGQSVELKSGGFHLMLMDLKQTLVAGSTVAMTLVFKDSNGVETQQILRLPVANTAPSGEPAMPHQHQH